MRPGVCDSPDSHECRLFRAEQRIAAVEKERDALLKRCELVEPLLAKRGNDFADGLIEVAAERDALRVEVEAMRPVVEAAVSWNSNDEFDLSITGSLDEQLRRNDALMNAVDAYRATAKEGA